MAVELSRLANGLKIVSDATPGLETTALGVHVPAGARFERDSEQGLSHLLEHMAFKGTGRRDARAIAEAIENAGGDLNAATGIESTAYYARVLREDCALALDVLADILTDSRFDAQELAREKEVVLEEIASVQDAPEDWIMDLFNAAAFPDQPIGRAILGTADTVQAFDREAISAYLARRYRPSGMVVSAAGAVDHAALRDEAEKLFGHLPAAELEAAKPAAYRGGEILVAKKLEQTQLVIGFEGAAHDAADVYAAHIFSNAVGGGMASPLFQEVRESRGLAYSISSFHWSFLDSGLFGIEAACAGGKLREVIAVSLACLAEAAEALDPKSFSRAKAQSKVGLLTALESPSARAEQIARQTMIFGAPLAQSEMISRIEGLTLEEVREAGKKMLRSAPTVAILGATKKAPHAADVAAALRGV